MTLQRLFGHIFGRCPISEWTVDFHVWQRGQGHEKYRDATSLRKCARCGLQQVYVPTHGGIAGDGEPWWRYVDVEDWYLA